MRRIDVETSYALALVACCSRADRCNAQKLVAPYASLTTAAALKAAQAALARCDKEGYTAAVAVVDRGGHALVLLRNGLAGAHTVRTAIDKAWTALSFRTDTTELARVLAVRAPAERDSRAPECRRDRRRHDDPREGLAGRCDRRVRRAGRRCR